MALDKFFFFFLKENDIGTYHQIVKNVAGSEAHSRHVMDVRTQDSDDLW